MRKYLLVFTMVAVILGGCSSKPTDEQIPMDPSAEIEDNEGLEEFEIEYSLMYDQQTQNDIKKLFKENGVSDQNIESFFSYVNDFNQIVGPMKGSEAGFHEGNILGALFDYEQISNAWMEERLYSDMNCRLTAFTLMKDLITVNSDTLVEAAPDNFIEFDMEALKEMPLIKFTDEELNKYYNFYSAIPTVATTDQAILLKSIQNEWEKRGVTFETGENISLVSVFLHYPDTKTLYIGHTGILMKVNEGYLFVEKVAPLDVYMATKHETLDDFEDYLEALYGKMIIPEGAAPLFLLNDQLLD